MTATLFLEHLTTLGISLSITSEGQLAYEAPNDEAMTLDLLHQLQSQKAALLALLQQGSATDPPSVSPPDLVPGALHHMHSAVLDCPFWVVATDAQAVRERGQSRAAYSQREVRLLQDLKQRCPEGFEDRLRQIHDLVVLFGATVESVLNPTPQRHKTTPRHMPTRQKEIH